MQIKLDETQEVSITIVAKSASGASLNLPSTAKLEATNSDPAVALAAFSPDLKSIHITAISPGEAKITITGETPYTLATEIDVTVAPAEITSVSLEAGEPATQAKYAETAPAQ